MRGLFAPLGAILGNFWGVTGPGPSQGRRLELCTPPLVAPGGRRSGFTARFGAAFAGPGQARIRFTDHSVRPAALP